MPNTTHLDPPFNLPAPTLILVGAGTQTLDTPGAARVVFCAPLVGARYLIATARGAAYGAPVYFVSGRLGLISPEAFVSGPEGPLVEIEDVLSCVELLKSQLDTLNVSIVEVHMPQHIEAVVNKALAQLGAPYSLTKSHTNQTLSGAFSALQKVMIT
jgi:hypothetical protein